MKQIVLLLLVLFASCGSGMGRQAKHKVNPESVYVCTGGSAKRYHSVGDCKGLSRCSGVIDELTLEEAENIGKTPCRMCVK